MMSGRSAHVGLILTFVKCLTLLAFFETHAYASNLEEDFLHFLLGLPPSQCKAAFHPDTQRLKILAYHSFTSENEGLFLLKKEPRFAAANFILANSSSVDSDNPLTINVMGAFGGGLLATFALLLPCLRRQKKHESKDFPSKGTSVSVSISCPESSFGCSSSTARSSFSQQPWQRPQGGRTFTLAELSRATRKFSLLCKIGQGGFGIVYRGKLEDGTLVAIKRAKKKVYDSRLSTEFDNEVEMLLSIDHLNLVKIIGYLDESDERILVVEYVPNGNLREHLDGVHGVILDLSMRLEICIDVAHALTYLHMYAGKPIIHRDVKPSNILLTEKFRAKVADFGYSRMGPIEIGETHVSTEIKGTTGYLDPEYLKTFQLTEKSDVYSFGIVLLEILTGRRPIDEKKDMKERVVLRWAFKLFLNGKVMEVLDPRLEKTNAACKVAERVCELAFRCTAPTKQDRPTMKEVAETLWNVRKEYQELLESTLMLARLSVQAVYVICIKGFREPFHCSTRSVYHCLERRLAIKNTSPG
ncbi:hypothetical protein GOP47_0030001 [Adiantum capillus-veneris]|nr:hypothetical protein GOP47_0030001 [Adiantum capillus-veneris]